MIQSIRNFIVSTGQAFNESYITKSGLEIFADRRHSADKLSNRVVTVVAIPAEYDGEIEAGYELMVDPTIFYRQDYGKGEQDNPYMIDRAKGIYKIEPGMVVLYRKSADDEWAGFGNSLMIEVRTEVVEKKVGAILIGTENKETIVVLYSNKELIEQGVNKGDAIALKKDFEIPFWIDGKEFFWTHNAQVLAKLN